MQQTLTVVLDRGTPLEDSFTTEPYEVAWAREAQFFVRPLQVPEDISVELVTQISPDGLHWCDHVPAIVNAAAGSADTPTGLARWRPVRDDVVVWPVSHFGGWLRLRGRLHRQQGSEPEPSVAATGSASNNRPAQLEPLRALIYLTLKG